MRVLPFAALLLIAAPAAAGTPERLLPPIVSMQAGETAPLAGSRPFVLGSSFQRRFAQAWRQVHVLTAGQPTPLPLPARLRVAEVLGRNGLTIVEYDEIIRMAADNPHYRSNLARVIAIEERLTR